MISGNIYGYRYCTWHYPEAADCQNYVNSTSENWAEYLHDYDFVVFKIRIVLM